MEQTYVAAALEYRWKSAVAAVLVPETLISSQSLSSANAGSNLIEASYSAASCLVKQRTTGQVRGISSITSPCA
jgi:hypothetical protein